MWRFVLKENLRRFDVLRKEAPTDADRENLRQLIEETEAELAQLEEESTPELARRDAALKFLSERAVDEALKRHRAQFGSLQIFDEVREHLIILAQRNFRAPFLQHLARMRPGDGSACGRCLAENAPAVIEDVNSDLAFEPHREAAREAGFQAVHAAPVQDRSGDLIAVLSTYYTAPQAFSEDELYQMASYARSVGPGLEGHIPR